MPKVVALSAPFPGVIRVFQEGEKLGLWKFIPLEGERIAIPTADTYILGAWTPEYEKIVAALGGRIGILWTSSGGEIDMEPIEAQYFTLIVADPRISFIWFGEPGLAEVFPDKGFYAPYPLSTEMDHVEVDKRDSIAFFNPGGLKKNCLNQFLAVAIVQRQKDLLLETNLAHCESLMASLGIKYRLYPWMPTELYHQVLASCRVALCVSWAETLSYFVAEAALLGVPSVISNTVPLLTEEFRVSNPNSPIEIAEKLTSIASVSNYAVLAEKQVRAWAERSNAQLEETLDKQGLI